MANIFYWFYKFSRSHKILSIAALTAITGLSILAILQLKFEENIVAIMPKDAEVDKVSRAFDGFEMNKRLVFHLYTKNEDQGDSLIGLAHIFAEKLVEKADQYVADIKLEIPDDQILKLYDFYYKNLPFYLTENDYTQLAGRISEEGVDLALKQLYKSLISPMGVVTKTMLIKDPFGFTSFPLERTKELQLDENFSLYKNHILTQDKKHLMFFVKLVNPANETAGNGELIEVINGLVSEMGSKENISVEYFGAAAVAVANANRIKKDIYLTVTLAIIGLFLFISLFYRKISVFFIVVTPGLFGGLVSAAILSLITDQVSVISLAIGSVLLGITIDYALHFFTHAKKEKDIAKLFEDLSSPLLISSLTTACAFYSLLFIRSTALQDLGIFAGTSIVVAALFTLLVLPHFLGTDNNEKESKRSNWVEQAVSSIANYPLHKKKWAFALILVISIVSLFTWHQVRFESNMLGLNYMPKDLADSEKNINQISNYSANNIYLTTTGDNIWQALAANEPLEQMLKKFEADSIIFDHVSLNKVVPTLAIQNKRLMLWDNFWEIHNASNVMSTLNKKANSLGFNDNTFSSIDSIFSTSYDQINTQDLDVLMSVLGEDLVIRNDDGTVSVLTIIKLSAENKQFIFDQVAAIPSITILDRGYLTTKLISLLNEDFNKLVNISLAVVFVLILLFYGRIELAIITFVPILLSWLWVLGVMGFFDLKFNIVNIIICTFIFGLGIDYSIFVMRGLTQQYSTGVDNLISYKKSIVLSAVTTLLGIGVLAFAQHPALKSIALLAIIGIASVIIITFSVEHVLYNFLIGNRKRKGVVPFTLASLIFTIIAFTTFLLGCFTMQIVRPLLLIPIGSLRKRKRVMHWFLMFFCGSIIRLMANFKKKIVDSSNMDYSKPSVIIANHHSFIDILILLMFSPKVVMVTNDWVYYSPFFGKPVQFADFISASKGVENQMDDIQQLVNDGYSIAVFPEGRRSGSFELRRFHKGAFYLADYLKLDIQPLVLHGASLVMPRGDDFYLKNNDVTIKYLPRIKHDDTSFGSGYVERSKKITSYFKAEHQKVREHTETPEFFKEVLIKNYLFKGPILEWYVRIKLRLENNYQMFHELIPKRAKILDLGCGYGIMSHALAFSSSEREIKGIDYDLNKINLAQNCPVKPENLTFAHGDVATLNFEHADVFLLFDVLHYFTREEQQDVMTRMVAKLNRNGLLIIRDGDSDKSKRHKGTKLTEFFSTNFGFNKTRNKLNYISSEVVKSFADQNNLELKVIDNTTRTSNTTFVLKRK